MDPSARRATNPPDFLVKLLTMARAGAASALRRGGGLDSPDLDPRRGASETAARFKSGGPGSAANFRTPARPAGDAAAARARPVEDPGPRATWIPSV